MPLPPDFFPRMNGFLQPFMVDPDEREAWLTQAYYLREPRLYHQIDRAGSAMVFTTKCIQKLLAFQCLTNPDEHSLAVLLNTVRYGCGEKQQHEIDGFVEQVNALCVDPPEREQTPEVPSVLPKNPAQSLSTPNTERTPTVFVSYSHDDKEFAERLIRDLQAAGHAIWIDVSRLKGGDVWIRAISEGIINSYAFVVVATERSLGSSWVQDEITWAKQRGKLIIPLLLEDVLTHPDFFPLARYQGIKFFGAPYETALRDLVAGLPASPTSAEPLIQPPKVTQRALELQYLDRLRFEVLLNTERYTPLSGKAEKRAEQTTHVPFVLMRPEYLLLERTREGTGEIKRFDNAVDELLSLRRAVVLGEPGAGKTTTLWKLARDLADAAIADEKAPIPLVIRLGRWTEEGQSLEDFIRAEVGALGLHVDDLLRDGRAALLLDGLNEIPVSRRALEGRDHQVRRMFERHHDLICLLTCRAQDYTLDLGFNKVEITPLDPIRIKEFCVHYLGDIDGQALFERLIGSRAVQTERDFMQWTAKEQIKQPEHIFWLEPTLPNGKKWGRESWNWQRWLREREQPASLLVLSRNPYMLSMLTQVYIANQKRLPNNRGELFREFAVTLLVRERLVELDAHKRPIMNLEAEALLDALAKLAYAMQIERAPGKRAEGNALTVLSLAHARKYLTEKQIYQSGSASLITVSGTVRFSHQLLQEYFAARYMDTEIKAARLNASTIWKPENWWERTNWEEAAVLLAGLYSDDCTPVLNWLADANPEVAALCIAQSGATTPDDTKRRLRDQWVPRLTDLKCDPSPLARAAIGRALALFTIDDLPADNRKGVSVIMRGGVKLPDIDWVSIPGGEFIYQKDQQITLPAFQISRFLITYVQFQVFIDMGDGWNSPEWWQGLSASDDHKAQPGDQGNKFWNHPRERVSWYDAVAFCRWLSAKLGYNMTLPTEQQYERAARWTDGRVYPYTGAYDPQKANTRDTNTQQTSAVGIFPNGASVEGIHDLSGNVWEWCLNKYRNSDDIELYGTDVRVLRGGAWNERQILARASYRLNYYPPYRNLNLGFRVVRP